MKTTFLNILKNILRILAKATLWRYKPIVVGITGNVGKTSTKEAVNIVLGHEKKVRTSSKNFNNELGFPLAILGNWKETGGVVFWIRVIIASVIRLAFKAGSYPEILVLEYGVDRPGDMQYLLDIARPQIGVVTAIGEIPVHIEFFAGKDSVAREKAKLVNCLPATGFALLNADDVTVYEMKDQTRARVVTYGFSENADMRITSFETAFSPTSEKSGKSAGLTFKLNYGGSFIPVRLNNVLGRAQAYSAAAASALGLTFGINLVSISEELGRYASPPGRLRVIPGIKDTTIIDDSYNASPLAVEEALHALGSIKTKRKIAVLGDMLEIGQYTMEAHESIGKLAAKTADLLITLGIRAKFIAEGANKGGMPRKDIFIFENVKEAGIFLQGTLKKGDVALVKGSQGVRMEEIVKEVMLEPERAKELLVRQDKRWLTRKGMYS